MPEQLKIQFLQDATDTRNESYKKLRAEGKDLSQADRLYELYIKHGDLTDREAAKIMGIPEARIAARRNKLMEEYSFLIGKRKVKDEETGRTVYEFGINNKQSEE